MIEEKSVKTYVFQIDLEPDEEGWRAVFFPLEHIGASTWGNTREDALDNIREVLSMIIEELEEAGQTIPTTEQIPATDGTLVTVTV